jgi:hypothetical protein
VGLSPSHADESDGKQAETKTGSNAERLKSKELGEENNVAMKSAMELK